MYNNFSLGSLAASEQLIRDLYINLRNKVNAWSEITKQTPQARMGYIGQHLVSVVTGHSGGKSGARGYDLIIDKEHYGEIKTCYRVDQLGSCGDCNAVVSSLERKCAECGSTNIIRKDDSKWLISIRNDNEFEKILEPEKYYFVLFEFENIYDTENHNIIASIWEVDPKKKGFGFCMMDYYLNIRKNCNSKAPFNMWPHQFKFALTNPKLIYRSIIKENGEIKTNIFPSLNNTYFEELEPLETYSQTKTITLEAAKQVLAHFNYEERKIPRSKKEILTAIEELRIAKNIPNYELCDAFADAIYLPLLIPHKSEIPKKLSKYYTELL